MTEYSITVYNKCYIIDYVDTKSKVNSRSMAGQDFFQVPLGLKANATLRAFLLFLLSFLIPFHPSQHSDNINTTNVNSYLAVQKNQTTPLSTLTPANDASLAQIKIKLNAHLRVCAKRQETLFPEFTEMKKWV